MHDEKLRIGIKQLGLTCPAQVLMDYLQLLQKWNATVNLTAITSLDDMIVKHLLDSLSIASLIQARDNTILDIGSGAGLPGIPLAINFPDKQVYLLDSNGKKTAFLLEAKRVLKLDNVTVVNARVEKFNSLDVVDELKFDVITCRAFSSVKDIYQKTKHLASLQTRWLLMRGAVTASELITAAELSLTSHELDVPFIEAQRHCIEMIRTEHG